MAKIGRKSVSEYYGSVLLDEAAAPAGTLVEAYSPRGDKVGCVPVGIPGYYPYMRVYGQDGPTPGMRNSEEVTFKVGGNLATTDPSPVIWINDWDQHQVNLTATTGVCYDLDPNAVVDIGDIQAIANAWRTADYDFNGSGIVDVGDIMTVAVHRGEPTSC